MASLCIAGDVYVKVNGRQLSVRGTCTISPNDQTREMVAGLDGIHGFTTVHRSPTIEVEITNRPQFPLTDLMEIGRVNDQDTVTAELANGEVWVLRGAVQTGDLELNAADGTCTVTFSGMGMRRQMSGAAA